MGRRSALVVADQYISFIEALLSGREGGGCILIKSTAARLQELVIRKVVIGIQMPGPTEARLSSNHLPLQLHHKAQAIRKRRTARKPPETLREALLSLFQLSLRQILHGDQVVVGEGDRGVNSQGAQEAVFGLIHLPQLPLAAAQVAIGHSNVGIKLQGLPKAAIGLTPQPHEQLPQAPVEVDKGLAGATLTAPFKSRQLREQLHVLAQIGVELPGLEMAGVGQIDLFLQGRLLRARRRRFRRGRGRLDQGTLLLHSSCALGIQTNKNLNPKPQTLKRGRQAKGQALAENPILPETLAEGMKGF